VEELRGVRAALALACRHRYEFPNINIFSDSLYSIENIRDRTSYWVFDPINHTYYTSSGNPVKNMEILAECLYLLEDLMRTNNVNLYHIKGHMNVDDNDSKAHKSVVIGANTFYRQNNIPHTLNMDYNLIRYCGAYNGLVDKLSRSLLYRSDVLVNNYRDAVYFELDHDVYFR
jgi:ribonuclease HI